MSNLYELPTGYQPPRVLDLCSNRLENVAVPLLLHSQPILLVGAGGIPQVWLLAPADPKGATWDYVVVASRSLSPAIRVRRHKESKEVILSAGQTIIVRARARGADSIEVPELDLRPVGLNVHGSRKGLFVGKSELVENEFVNLGAAIALGGPGQAQKPDRA